MYRLRKAAYVLSVIAAVIFAAGICSANYQFDDVLKNGVENPQWVIVNEAGDTFGGNHTEAIRVSADVMTSGTAVIDVLSGTSAGTVSDRGLQTFFMVLANGLATFDMSMRSKLINLDEIAPYPGVNTIVEERRTPYLSSLSADQSNTSSSEWKNYHYELARQTDTNKYDTTVQSFIFRQAGSSTPSQGITRPMVISNVYPGTAQDNPLIVRMKLRDNGVANGNIIAYDRATWDMTKSKTVENSQWVFVPVNDLNTDNAKIECFLTTEIANNTATRYAVRPPNSTGGTVEPDAWKFDIFRPVGMANFPHTITLAPESNIAPGLITVYNRRYDINEQNKTPIHVFPVPLGYGDYGLSLTHNIIFGKRLGETYGYLASEGRFNLFEVTAFQPRPASTNFYDTVASVTNSAGKVTPPSTAIFSAGSVKHNVIADDVLQYFTVDQSIPFSVRETGSEGIFPLHITFNIPVTMVNDDEWWNEMIKVWRDTGRIEDIFANKFDLFLMAGENNVWNLTQELRDKGHYNDLVKVFFDDDRGNQTRDNFRGLLTVSFIVMLMDGTRDGERPELSIVTDSSVAQRNDYIVIRDGELDNRWNMTFFIAPSGWQDNPSHSTDRNTGGNSGDAPSGVASGGSGGGGCSYGVFVPAMLAAFVLFISKERRI